MRAEEGTVKPAESPYGNTKQINEAIKVENKLADKAIRRELLGFWFDKEAAIRALTDLNNKMDVLRNNVEPLLPPKPMNKGELDEYTLPKRQLSKDNQPSKFLLNFCTEHKCVLNEDTLIFDNKEYINIPSLCCQKSFTRFKNKTFLNENL